MVRRSPDVAAGDDRRVARRDLGVLRRSQLAAAHRRITARASMATGAAQGMPSLGRTPFRSPRAAVARRGGRLMPEWPDLHVVRGRLEKALVGREIVLVRVGDPTVLRATKPIETGLAHRLFTT